MPKLFLREPLRCKQRWSPLLTGTGSKAKYELESVRDELEENAP